MNVADIQDTKTKTLAAKAQALVVAKVKTLTGTVVTKQTQINQLIAKAAAVAAKALKARK